MMYLRHSFLVVMFYLLDTSSTFFRLVTISTRKARALRTHVVHEVSQTNIPQRSSIISVRHQRSFQTRHGLVLRPPSRQYPLLPQRPRSSFRRGPTYPSYPQQQQNCMCPQNQELMQFEVLCVFLIPILSQTLFGKGDSPIWDFEVYLPISKWGLLLFQNRVPNFESFLIWDQNLIFQIGADSILEWVSD